MHMMLIGVVMTIVGWIQYRRGRRLPTDPHSPYCRSCDYNLTGLTSQRCPECGSDITRPRAVLMGVGPRAQRMKRAGLVLFVLGLSLTAVFGVVSVRHLPLYQYAPTSWVFRDAEDSSESCQIRGYLELQRRFASGRLDPADIQRLAGDALADHGRWDLSTGMSYWITQILAALRQAGALTVAQNERYERQNHLLKLKIRPSVLPNQPIPVCISAKGRMMSDAMQQGEILTVRVDGNPVDVSARKWHASGVGPPHPTPFILPPLPPGKHQLECDVRTGAVKLSPDDGGYVYLNNAMDRTLKAEFVVLTTKPAGYVKRTPSARLAADLAGMIDFQTPFISSDFDDQRRRVYPTLNAYLEVSATKSPPRIQSLPLSLAFDVIVRWEGGELLMGRCVFNKDEFSYQQMNDLSAEIGYDLPAEVRVILRASEEAALEDPDVYEIWDGELDLGIKRIKNYEALRKLQEHDQRTLNP